MTAPIPTPDSAPMRYVAFDALRGIAVLVVALAHTAQFSYGIEHPILSAVGRFGVVLFFLVSGFVIPLAFARNGSQRVFWIRRLCRLYPLYWLTIAVAAVLLAAGSLPRTSAYPARDAITYAVNLTMIPNFFGYSSVLSVFWTLHIEVLFYVLVAATGLLRLQHKPLLIGWAVIVLALLSGFVSAQIHYYSTFLALIWCGTVLGHTAARTISIWKAALYIAATMMLLVLDATQTDSGSADLAGTIAALAVFTVALRHPAWFEVRGLVWLGTISYSLYLTHRLVMAAVPSLGSPMLSMIVWLVCMLPVAAIAERWIERPSIALGRWLTTSDRPSIRQKDVALLNEKGAARSH